MSSHRARTLGGVLFIAIVLGSCGPPGGVSEPAAPPYLTGTVESVMHRATSSSILVRPGPGASDPCGIAATVDGETRYRRRIGDGSLGESGIADVELGSVVDVYVSGPVAESCPVQARASEIIVTTTLTNP